MLGEPTPHQKEKARGENSISKTSKVSNNTNRIPKIILDGLRLQRTRSESSLSSIESVKILVSATSTSSNMTAIAFAVSKKKWEEVAKLRKKMNCEIGLIKGRLKKMRESFERQKSVCKTVKDGVEDIVLWIEHVEEDHQEINGVQ